MRPGKVADADKLSLALQQVQAGHLSTQSGFDCQAKAPDAAPEREPSRIHTRAPASSVSGPVPTTWYSPSDRRRRTPALRGAASCLVVRTTGLFGGWRRPLVATDSPGRPERVREVTGGRFRRWETSKLREQHVEPPPDIAGPGEERPSTLIGHLSTINGLIRRLEELSHHLRPPPARRASTSPSGLVCPAKPGVLNQKLD
jgi:hypothetical protein